MPYREIVVSLAHWMHCALKYWDRRWRFLWSFRSARTPRNHRRNQNKVRRERAELRQVFQFINYESAQAARAHFYGSAA